MIESLCFICRFSLGGVIYTTQEKVIKVCGEGRTFILMKNNQISTFKNSVLVRAAVRVDLEIASTQPIAFR